MTEVLTADEQKLLEDASYENSEVQVDPLIVLVCRLVSRVKAAEARAEGMERAGAEQARRADENAEWAKAAEAAVKPGACGDNTSTPGTGGGYPRCDLNQAAEARPTEYDPIPLGDLVKAVGPTCRWIDDEDGVWSTSCDSAFVMEASSPKQNGMLYCPYCGRHIEEVPYQEETDDSDDHPGLIHGPLASTGPHPHRNEDDDYDY